MQETRNTSSTVRLRVWGRNACFTRPEMKVERVSYDVMTPSAARGILEAIHWKPAIRWRIDQIDVINPIKWESVRRNELSNTMSPESNGFCIDDVGNDGKLKYRQQRAGLFLRDVEYVIHAHFEMTERAGPEDNVTKHQEIFQRRAEKGQCFHRPYFGCREFAAHFALLGSQDSPTPINVTDELGFMLYDMAHDNSADKNGSHFCSDNCRAQFFRAKLENGRLVPRLEEVRS